MLDISLEGKREGMSIGTREKIDRIEEGKKDNIEEGVEVGVLIDNEIE